MASAPDDTGTATGASLSPASLMTLGMFLFGMDTIPYNEFQRRFGWRHESSERFMARPASQFVGPGDDTVTIGAKIVPEIAGSYSSIDTLAEMGDTGGNWPLIDGMGWIYGHFRIASLDLTHRTIMAGGFPRSIDFTIELTRES